MLKIILGIAIASVAMSAHAAKNRPDGYKPICKSGQTCYVKRSTKVAFGASGKFIFKTIRGTFKCDVSTFGNDPISKKKRKKCSIPKKRSRSRSSSSSSSGGNDSSRKNGCGSTPRGKVSVSSTIQVTGSFDGGCKEYISTFDLGDQFNNTDPVFRLKGGSIKNVFIGPRGSGIHVYGDAKLTNITWLDVNRTALTVKSPGNVTISNFEAFDTEAAIFQLNAKTNFKASNCTVKNMYKMFREKGGKCFPTKVSVNNCTLANATDGVFRSDCESSSMKISNSTVRNAKICHSDKFKCSGRSISR